MTDSANAQGTTSIGQAGQARRLRLQAVLLAVLALWFVDSGLPALSETGEESAGSSTLVSGEIESGAELEALATLLSGVNPELDAGQVDRIASAVLRYSAKYELDPELVTAVLLVESSVRPWARSPKGAVGLMQVMPHMMEPLQLAGNAATIEANIEAGCWILASNIRRLGEEAGISSYFWGSDIRGLAYLEKVRAAREEVRRHRAS